MPGVFHQDAAHRLRGGAEEVGPPAPLHAILVHQAEIRFMHQRRTIERGRVVFVLERPLGHALQIAVYQGYQLFKCLPITRAPANQEIGDIRHAP